jgi:hypothetical protein
VFATYQGIGSVVAARMAVEDCGGKAAGKVVEWSLPITRTRPISGSHRAALV